MSDWLERKRPPQDLRVIRETDLIQVMGQLGYTPLRRYGKTSEYRLEDGRKLAVTPEPRNVRKGTSLGMFQIWNGEALDGRIGGAGAIDLVMAVTGKSVRSASKWLESTFTTPTPPKCEMPSRLKHEATSERRFTLPVHNPEATPAVRRYLCEIRGLPITIVEPLLDRETIFANVHRYKSPGGDRQFINAVFVMRDDATEHPNGSIIRGCYDGFKPRKSTLPFENGNAAAFWLGTSLFQARAVVVTESPIECLSWLALHPTAAGIHCRSYGGNRWRSIQTVFSQVKATGAQLVCAFNNDPEGNRTADEFVQLAQRAEIIAIKYQPKTAKDWNDVLRSDNTTT